MQQIAKNKAKKDPSFGKPFSPSPLDRYLIAPPETVPSL